MLNVIDIKSFNEEAFNEKYSIYKVLRHGNGEKQINAGAMKCIYSTYWVSCDGKGKKYGEERYVLTPSADDANHLYDIFPKDFFSVSRETASEVHPRILLSLLIGALANRNLKVNNFTSKLFEVIRVEKRKHISPTVREAVTAGYEVSDDMILHNKTTTFTWLDDTTINSYYTIPGYKTVKQKVEEGWVQYYYIDNGYMVRNVGWLKTDAFIQRKYSSKRKNSQNFLSVTGSGNNKTARLFSVVNTLQAENSGIIKLGWKDVEYERILQCGRNQKNVFDLLENRLGRKMIINVINHTENSPEVINILNESGIPYQITNEIDRSLWNLSVVYSADHYKKNNLPDPYVTTNEYVIQHAIIDSFSKVTLNQCLIEMLVKQNVIDEEVTLFPLSGEWHFLKMINERVHQLIIVDNHIKYFGSVSINDQYADYIYQNAGRHPHIILHNGDQIIIEDTPLRLLPDWNTFKENLDEYKVFKDGKEKVNVRGKEARDKFFGEVIDINIFSYDGNRYYSVGEIGSGMNTKIANSAATKKVIEYGLRIEECADMLQPNMLHVNKYCTLPFPFKIADEVFRLNGGIILREGNEDE